MGNPIELKKCIHASSHRLVPLQSIGGQYYSAHLRFFRQLCTAAKVDKVSELARGVLNDGKCVVVGLQSTGKSCCAFSASAAW